MQKSWGEKWKKGLFNLSFDPIFYLVTIVTNFDFYSELNYSVSTILQLASCCDKIFIRHLIC